MGARAEARDWAAAVEAVAADRSLRYERVGGLNPAGGPAALCPGGRNRITGELAPGFWGACCDAMERMEGGFLGIGAVGIPEAILFKSHMPDLASVLPPFNVESLERTVGDLVDRASRRRVEFESIAFNRRFIATVPSEHDPVAVREMFSPAFLEWAVGIDREVDFGVSEQQLYFMWHLRELSRTELELALDTGDGLFARVHREMAEEGVALYPPGPWHAGLEPFPSGPQGAPGAG